MRILKCFLARKIWQFLACLSLSLCFAQGANSADFYWNISIGPGKGQQFGSASAACVSSQSLSSGAFISAQMRTNTAYDCRWFQAAAPGYFLQGVAIRGGTTCPTGSIYNASTGSCDTVPDVCASQTGFKDHQHQIGSLDGTGSRVEPPSSICENSCQYAFTYEAPTDCYRFGDGTNKNGAFCKYKYKGNGTSCTNGPTTPPGSLFDQPPTKPPIALDPTLTKDIQCSDWVTKPDGTGSRSCSSVSEYKDPGKINCPPGTSGTVVCSPGTPAPDYKKEDVSTTEGKTKNPDGSSQSDTTKTTTTTVCKGTQPCTTTTKTEGDSTGTNPDGTAGDTSSTCTGSGCKPSTEEKPEEEEEESTVSGDGSCPAVPACTGDAIACAILRQTHQQRCNDEEFRKVDEQKISELKSSLNSEFSGPDYQEIKPTADSTFSLAGMLDTSSRFSASCPVFPVISYEWIGGAVNQLDLNSPGLCVFLTLMGYLNVAFAMRFAAEIIARGLS